MVLAAAAALACLPAAAGAEPPRTAGAAACITELPIDHRFRSGYSAAYRRSTMHLRLRGHGPLIRNVKAELYTFAGELVARSRIDKRGFRLGKLLRLRLRYGAMQSGSYTLVVTGEPNRDSSCGPKKYVRVVEFADCPDRLPIAFPNPPGGYAADYGEYLSVFLRTETGVLRDVRLELYSFSGVLFARSRVPALFGAARVDLRLRRQLRDGGYTAIASAPGALPRPCGERTSEQVLRFGLP